MFKYLSPFFVLLSSGMHLFCCGIPLLLSISSLGVIFGISGTAFEIEWFEAIEDKVMVVSGFVLFLSFFVDQFNKQRVCNEHADVWAIFSMLITNSLFVKLIKSVV